MGKNYEDTKKMKAGNKKTSAGRGSKKAQKREKTNRFLGIFTVVVVVATFVAVIVFYTIYFRFAHYGKKLTYEASRIYAFGTGQDMKELIPPGYVKKYEESSKVLGIDDIQDIYIGKFRDFVWDKVGDIDNVDCHIKDIQAVSNVEIIATKFAENGVLDVTQYRQVDADWIITGKNDEKITVQVQVYVLKCNDGWYVDYVQLPNEITSGEGKSEDASGEE